MSIALDKTPAVDEDGQFLCDDHKPERKNGQWWLEIAFDEPCKCDHCDQQAAFFVLDNK